MARCPLVLAGKRKDRLLDPGPRLLWASRMEKASEVSRALSSTSAHGASTNRKKGSLRESRRMHTPTIDFAPTSSSIYIIVVSHQCSASGKGVVMKRFRRCLARSLGSKFALAKETRHHIDAHTRRGFRGRRGASGGLLESRDLPPPTKSDDGSGWEHSPYVMRVIRLG